MTDQLDTAKELEMLHEAKSLKQHREAAREPEQWIQNGMVLCIDCSAPVSKKRLAAKPNAARCIHCQTHHERG